MPASLLDFFLLVMAPLASALGRLQVSYLQDKAPDLGWGYFDLQCNWLGAEFSLNASLWNVQSAVFPIQICVEFSDRPYAEMWGEGYVHFGLGPDGLSIVRRSAISADNTQKTFCQEFTPCEILNTFDKEGLGLPTDLNLFIHTSLLDRNGSPPFQAFVYGGVVVRPDGSSSQQDSTPRFDFRGPVLVARENVDCSDPMTQCTTVVDNDAWIVERDTIMVPEGSGGTCKAPAEFAQSAATTWTLVNTEDYLPCLFGALPEGVVCLTSIHITTEHRSTPTRPSPPTEHPARRLTAPIRPDTNNLLPPLEITPSPEVEYLQDILPDGFSLPVEFYQDFAEIQLPLGDIGDVWSAEAVPPILACVRFPQPPQPYRIQCPDKPAHVAFGLGIDAWRIGRRITIDQENSETTFCHLFTPCDILGVLDEGNLFGLTLFIQVLNISPGFYPVFTPFVFGGVLRVSGDEIDELVSFPYRGPVLVVREDVDCNSSPVQCTTLVDNDAFNVGRDMSVSDGACQGKTAGVNTWTLVSSGSGEGSIHLLTSLPWISTTEIPLSPTPELTSIPSSNPGVQPTPSPGTASASASIALFFSGAIGLLLSSLLINIAGA